MSETIRKSAEMQLVELRHGAPIEELLDAELKAGRSPQQIADKWGLARMTVYNWMRTLGYRVDWVNPHNQHVGSSR